MTMTSDQLKRFKRMVNMFLCQISQVVKLQDRYPDHAWKGHADICEGVLDICEAFFIDGKSLPHVKAGIRNASCAPMMISFCSGVKVPKNSKKALDACFEILHKYCRVLEEHMPPFFEEEGPEFTQQETARCDYIEGLAIEFQRQHDVLLDYCVVEGDEGGDDDEDDDYVIPKRTCFTRTPKPLPAFRATTNPYSLLADEDDEEDEFGDEFDDDWSHFQAKEGKVASYFGPNDYLVYWMLDRHEVYFWSYC